MVCPSTPLHVDQVLGLVIISGVSSRFLLFTWQISSHNMACFLDKDDCVGAFKTSKKDHAELVCVSLPVVLVPVD